MVEIRRYIVGGYVRDQVIGRDSHDVDYAVEAPSYNAMREWIIEQGGQIFQERPEFVTIRARMGRETADFVLCRRDGAYSDGRRPDEVFAGTIDDDLARRDFTMNAIAIREDGSYYDPFGGIEDIGRGVIRCVGNTEDRMREDYIRLMRAARFSVTLGMEIGEEIERMFFNEEIVGRMVCSVSQSRIREEVAKMFAADTIASINFFSRYPLMAQACFSDRIWLRATDENRGHRV